MRHPPSLPGPQPGGGRAQGAGPPQAAEDAHGADGGAVQVCTQGPNQVPGTVKTHLGYIYLLCNLYLCLR